MKKFLCLTLAFVLCICSICPVNADDGEAVAKLIVSVKDKFNIGDEFTIMDYSKSNYKGNVVYYLSWEAKSDNEYDYRPYINVRVRENGQVEYYNISQNNYGKVSLPKFSKDEAIKKATEWLHKIAPEKASCVKAGQVAEGVLYTINFERTQNNIPVPSDSISIDLNPTDLSLTGYRANWSDGNFEGTENIISLESAKQKYIEKLGYEPMYNIVTKDKKTDRIYISYEPKHPTAYIDAITGEEKVCNDAVFSTMENVSMDSATSKGEGSYALSPEEQMLVNEVSAMLTKEDAEKLVRGIDEFSIEDDAVVNECFVSKNKYGEYLICLYFSREIKDNYYHAQALINAKTKEIVSFSEYYEKDKSADKKFDTDKAKKSVESFLKKYYPEKFSQTQPKFTVGDAPLYDFSFDRYANNIKVKNNGFRVSLDSSTGEIRSFSCEWADVQFPPAENIIARNFIYKLLMAEGNFRLQYNVAKVFQKDEKTGEDTQSDMFYLVYTPYEKPIYNAEGVEIDGAGMPLKEKFCGYDDIGGHYCEKSATELAKIGIYFEGNSLNPDEPTKQEDFLRLLLKATNGYDYPDTENMYRTLLNTGVISKEEIGMPLTRIDGIRYFINLLGYKEAAQIKGIYNCPFSDVEYDMQGYVSIAGGLYIINTSVDNFNPTSPMTKAQCLTVIYNYLSR